MVEGRGGEVSREVKLHQNFHHTFSLTPTHPIGIAFGYFTIIVILGVTNVTPAAEPVKSRLSRASIEGPRHPNPDGLFLGSLCRPAMVLRHAGTRHLLPNQACQHK